MTPESFAIHLLQLGIELGLRQSGRIKLWPKTAYNSLPESDREFIRSHHAEFHMMVRDGLAPRLPQDHPGFPTSYDGPPLYGSAGNPVAQPSPIPVTTTAEPQPVVWTRDYSRRITESDVIAVFGKVPTVNKKRAYEHTREHLAQQQRSRVLAERYHKRGLDFHNPSLEQERYES